MNDQLLRNRILESGKVIFGLFATEDTFLNISYLAEGEENLIFKIAGKKGVYAARILKPGTVRTETDYHFESEYVDYLRAHQIPVPRHYKTIENDLYAVYELGNNALQITLHDFIDGDTVTAPNAHQIEVVGTLLGRLHKLAHGFNPAYDALEHTDALGWINDVVKTPESSALAEDAFSLYTRYGKFIQNNIHHLKKFPLHNDIHFGNLLFQGNKLVAILDFNEAHKHYIPLELGWSMGQVCNFGGLDDFKINLGIFKKAYLGQYQLTELEDSMTISALVAETCRKVLKHPSDPIAIQRFNNIREWEVSLPTIS